MSFCKSVRDARFTIIPRSFELVRNFECQVLLLGRPYIDVLDGTRLRSHRSEFHTVHEGFPKGNVFDTAVIETVDVVPDCGDASAGRLEDKKRKTKLTVDFLLFIVFIFYRSEEQSCFVREHEAVRRLFIVSFISTGGMAS